MQGAAAVSFSAKVQSPGPAAAVTVSSKQIRSVQGRNRRSSALALFLMLMQPSKF